MEEHPLAQERYVALTTYRRTGEAVTTPVWVVGLTGGRLGHVTGSTSGTVQRLAADPRVLLSACDVRGRVASDAIAVGGTARVVRSGADADEVRGRIRERYGLAARLAPWRARLTRRPVGDVVLVVTPEAPQPSSSA